jgi:hypothetical protein
MADSGYNFREFRVVYFDDITHCYVFLEAIGDCPVGVHGWHYKAFPPTISGQEIFLISAREAVMWPLKAPETWSPETERQTKERHHGEETQAEQDQ